MVSDIDELQNIINLYQNRLKISLKRKIDLMRMKLEKVISSNVYRDPYIKINNCYMQVDKLFKQIEVSISKIIKDKKMKFSNEVAKLDVLSPLKTLSRGYCVAELDNKIITKAKDLKPDLDINLKFQDGDVKAKII